MQFHTRTIAIVVSAVGLVAGVPGALGQSETDGSSAKKNGTPARSVGHQGQRVRMPGMANPGRSLPIQRQLTLPGLSPTPQGTGGQPVVGQPGVYPIRVRSGDGVQVNGSYDDGNLALRFHLGSGATLLPDGTVCYPRGVYTTGYYLQSGGYGSGYRYNPYWYYDSGRYWSSRPVDGVLARQIDPTLVMAPQPQTPAQPSEPVRELTALELAHAYFAADEAERAIQAFRDHLIDDPEDVDAMRGLGLAMLDAGRLSDGTAMVALAYRTDALLARSPVDLDELGLGARRHDRLLSRVLAYAKRSDASSAHLAGVVLLQAEGKYAGATRVLDRAERAGLDEGIVDAFRRELGTPAHR